MQTIKLTGIGDEASTLLSGQTSALRELGWTSLEARTIECPGFPKANIHDLVDPAFDLVVRHLEQESIEVHCFGSTIMNWACSVSDEFQTTVQQVKRAIHRMQRLQTRFVRIMSYKPADDDYRIPSEVFRRVREVTQRFIDAGLQPLHENCMNYGGMSWNHALDLLDKCPGLKWLFDTGNPLLNTDRSKHKPWPIQDPWEFWTRLRDHTAHIHVKDVRLGTDSDTPDYCWPGDGAGRIQDILKDAVEFGYEGAVSIEPHMVSIFHDQANKPDESAKRKNFVEYGRVLEKLVAEASQLRPRP